MENETSIIIGSIAIISVIASYFILKKHYEIKNRDKKPNKTKMSSIKHSSNKRLISLDKEISKRELKLSKLNDNYSKSLEKLKSAYKKSVDEYKKNPDLISKQNQIKEKMYQEVPPSEYFKRIPSWIRRKLILRKAKKNSASIVLIRMEMNNGRHREFIVKEDIEKGGFMFNKGRYIFDLESKYFIVDSNIWAYDYHESFSLPVKRIIPVDDLKKGIELKNEAEEVDHSSNPKTLHRFILAEIAQGIMRGASLGALFKTLVIIVIIVLLVGLFDFGIDLYSSGLIQQIKLS